MVALEAEAKSPNNITNCIYYISIRTFFSSV